MLKERERLEEVLNLILSKYAHNSKIKESAEDAFISKGINIADVADMMTKRIDLRTVNDTILYIFTKALFDADIEDKNKINPEKWFTKTEIDLYDKYKEEKSNTITYPIEFENARQKMQDYYVVDISIQKLVELLSSRIIKYNPKTQRKLKLKERKGIVIEEIDVDKTQVKEIAERILSGEQFPNFLILNVLQDGNDDINFINNKSDIFGTLVINSGEIDALDGFHRMLGSMYALKQNPDLEFNWGVIVVNYDEIKAAQFMIQEQKGRKMNQEQVAALDINRLENLTVQKINNNAEYDLYNKIVPTEGEIRVGKGWTKFSIMEEAIIDNFADELNSKFDANKIADKLSKGLNEIIGGNINVFSDRSSIKTSVMNNKNIYPMYVYMIKHLYETQNWEEKINSIINNIDFSKDNPFWSETGVINPLNKDINKSQRAKLYAFAEEKIKEVL